MNCPICGTKCVETEKEFSCKICDFSLRGPKGLKLGLDKLGSCISAFQGAAHTVLKQEGSIFSVMQERGPWRLQAYGCREDIFDLCTGFGMAAEGFDLTGSDL